KQRGDRVAGGQPSSAEPVNDPIGLGQELAGGELTAVRLDEGQVFGVALRRLPEAPLGHVGESRTGSYSGGKSSRFVQVVGTCSHRVPFSSDAIRRWRCERP